MAENCVIDVVKEKQKDGTFLYKVDRVCLEARSMTWFTRLEAEDLHAQLENVLYKEQ